MPSSKTQLSFYCFSLKYFVFSSAAKLAKKSKSQQKKVAQPAGVKVSH
jgi:hypothetical protein